MTKVLYYKKYNLNKDVWPKHCITKVNKDVWPKYCITKVNKDVWPKYCITKVNKDVMYCITKVNIVLYYKSKQRCYDQSIVLQK